MSGTFPVYVHHGKRKQRVDVTKETQMVEVMQRAWDLYSIPVENQRLVYKGRQVDPNLKAFEVGLQMNARLMVIGDPIAKIPSGAGEKMFDKYETQLKTLEEELGAAESRQKIAGVGEACQRALESLDALSIPPSDADLKTQRKQYVKQFLTLQDNVDTALTRSSL
ncbi:hypothetical protein DIPPA_10239 [Diplonema papillatum]|nr:hypothetical protein DIPPA_10239 [Diplonema papillatum]KAJ9469562.1 hypothetical protein DIPPA_10239 [Diplonema papillatum]